MPLNAANLVPNGPVKSADIKQYYDLFTGLMTDQPVTYRNVVSIGGNQGLTTVPLKVYGVTGQTSNLIDLYVDRSQAQPSFGLGSTGTFRWGPGGAAPTDTSMSRIGTQNGHTTDTAGLLILPRLEVGGQMVVGGNVTINGTLNVTNVGGGSNIPVPDPLNITRINFNPVASGAFIQAYAADTTYVHIPKLTVTPGITALAGLQVNGSTVTSLDNTVGRNSQVNGQSNTNGWVYSQTAFGTPGRIYCGNYDAGWPLNVGGNGIASGRFYQRGNGGCYCYDVLDFTISQGITANTVVQRLGDGGIQVGSLYIPTGAQGGSPAYIAGQTGDGYLRWWPRSAAGGAVPNLWQQRLTAGVDGNPSSFAVGLPWSGYYFAVATARGGEFSGEWQLECRMIVGPNQYWENYGTDAKPGHPQWDDSYVRVYMPATFHNAGEAAYFTTRGSYGYDPPNGDNNSVMYIVFIPTPQYPGG